MKTPQQQNESQRWREDESLRKKVAGHEVTPPSYLWDAIEQKLPASGQRRSFMSLYILAMAACLAGIGLYFFAGKKDSDKNLEIVNNKTAKIENTDNHITANNESNISTTQIENNQPESKITSAESKSVTENYNSKHNFTSNQKSESPLKKAKEEENFKTTYITDKVNNSVGNETTISEISPISKTPENKIQQTDKTSTNPVKNVSNKIKHQWEIGVGTNLGYSYRFASKIDSQPHTTSINPNEDNKIELKEKGALYRSISVMTRYHLSNSLSVIAAFHYGKSAIHSEIKQGYYQPVGNGIYNTGTFTAYSDLGKSKSNTFSGDTSIRSGCALNGVFGEKTIPVKYYFRNFELPISLEYLFNLKKLGFYLQGGPQFNFIHKYNMEIYDSSSNSYVISDVKEPYNKLQAGFNFSTGLNIPMKTFTINTGPYFSGMLTNLNKNPDSRILLYNWGMAVKVWYTL